MFAVLGNHDWKQAGDRMWSALTAAGIEVLENRAVPAGDFHVAGLADLRLRRPDLPTTLATVPPGEPVILLAHDPDVFPYVPDRVALTLSGHLHGGQVAIPVIRRPALPSRYGERYARGHVVEEDRHLYVSSGIGTSGLPLRFLAPPEVVVLELVSRARGICWTAQPFPSGSVKKTNRPHGKSWTSLTSTPRPERSSCAASMSATTSCRPCTEPGSVVMIPIPMAIEHPEPGGVSCTKRISSLTRWSWSALKPTCS